MNGRQSKGNRTMIGKIRLMRTLTVGFLMSAATAIGSTAARADPLPPSLSCAAIIINTVGEGIFVQNRCGRNINLWYCEYKPGMVQGCSDGKPNLDPGATAGVGFPGSTVDVYACYETDKRCNSVMSCLFSSFRKAYSGHSSWTEVPRERNLEPHGARVGLDRRNECG
jgi:hypothetical protein